MSGRGPLVPNADVNAGAARAAILAGRLTSYREEVCICLRVARRPPSRQPPIAAFWNYVVRVPRHPLVLAMAVDPEPLEAFADQTKTPFARRCGHWSSAGRSG